MTNRSVRQSNIEMLRIIAILMIIAFHFSVHGVMHYLSDDKFCIWNTGTTCNKMVTSLLFPGGEVGVGIFFIITGYFCIDKNKVSVLKVALQTSFYGVFTLALVAIIKLFDFGYNNIDFFSDLKSALRIIILPATGGGTGLLQLMWSSSY